MTKAEKRAAAIAALKEETASTGAPPEVAAVLTLVGDMLDSLERIAVALEKPAPTVLNLTPSDVVTNPDGVKSALDALSKLQP